MYLTINRLPKADTCQYFHHLFPSFSKVYFRVNIFIIYFCTKLPDGLQDNLKLYIYNFLLLTRLS